MFSVMKTGTWRRPSWTAMVSPTISGMMVDARAQVRITVRLPERWTCSTLWASLGWT
jgi:TolB-like protein